MDIEAVRQGLATAASAVSGLNCYGYVPDSISEPAFFPAEVDITFDRAFDRGMDELTITCRVLVGRADDKASQKLLNGYLSGSGSSSLKAALEGTPGVAQTLGGACDDLHVMRVQGYRFYEHAGAEYVGAELVVRVIGEG
jgi:hypothetical protein